MVARPIEPVPIDVPSITKAEDEMVNKIEKLLAEALQASDSGKKAENFGTVIE